MTAEARGLPAARKAELQAAGLKICAAALVLAGLFALYAHEVKVEQQVADLLARTKIAGGRAGGARTERNKDTPRSWLAAEDALQKGAGPATLQSVRGHGECGRRGAARLRRFHRPRAEGHDAVARAEGRDERAARTL